MDITLAHWLYLAGTVAIIATMLLRQNVVVPAIAATFLVAWSYQEDLVTGLKAVFNASLTAAGELFNIFLIIALMTALLNALKKLRADERMIRPVQRVMLNGHLSFFVLAAITYIISLFFWPTPAVPLVAAILIPAALYAGLPAMGAAVAISLAGQGMALSSDYIIQIAPQLSASAAGVHVSAVSDKAFILSLITGLVAIPLAYVLYRKEIRKPGEIDVNQWQNQASSTAASEEFSASETAASKPLRFWSRFFAVLVPISLLAIVAYMVTAKFSSVLPAVEGGDGAAFIGGTAALLLILASLAFDWRRSLQHVSDHLVDGFIFAFKAMGPVLPIAGFFFIGSGDFSGRIMGLGAEVAAPAFLFELVQAGQNMIPDSGLLTAFGVLIIGMITGLDGSGFSGLPLTGALSGALGSTAGMDPATLAAIGQMGAIWVGGGTLIAWSSLVAVAGFARVPVLELVRKNFLPVIVGLVVSTLFAIWFW